MAIPVDELAIERVAALEDPTRRQLYVFVGSQGGQDVSRDQAAAGVGISRGLAAFHLDKLVEVGLLECVYRRLGERRGPGAGRPAKLYRRTRAGVEVSLPHREYALAGSLLALAITSEPSTAAGRQLDDVAARFGEEIGRRARKARIGRAARGLADVAEAVNPYGFEPRISDQHLTLQNCPFQALSQEQPELICGMNLHLQKGVVAGIGAKRVTAALNPAPGRCCVTFGNASRASKVDSHQC